jgi:hypothetical protein
MIQAPGVCPRGKNLKDGPFGQALALLKNIRLYWKDLPEQHSSLFDPLVNYGRKKFNNIGLRSKSSVQNDDRVSKLEADFHKLARLCKGSQDVLGRLESRLSIIVLH